MDGADDLTEYVWGTDLLNPDTDGDWLNDWDEYLIGTDARNRDTDEDRVHDGLEVQIWFPPTHGNWDGDAYDDYEEFDKKGTSPYIYDMTGAEYLNCFLSGVLWGDTIREVDNVATLAGQIVGGFCPISDLRDYFANGYYGDFGTALLNLFAMIPAMGDAASIANRVGKFIVNHTYDIAKMTEVLLFAAKNCPDVFKYLGKQDEILSYVKYLKAQKTLPITRMDATGVNNVLESLGYTDDLIKHGDDVGVRPAILDDVAEGGTATIKFNNWDEMKEAYKGTITKFVKENKPKYSPDIKKWFDKGGSLEIATVDGKQIWTYTSSTGDSVPYIDGYVKFPDEYLNPTIKSVDIGWFTGDRSKDIDKMMEILENDYGITEIPEGYIVHHDIENGILQLVDENIHTEFTHIGGHSIYQ